MLVDVRYLQRRGNAWRYRRKVPADLRPDVGKREILLPLGKTESDALRRYPKAHADAERILKEASRSRAREARPTPLDIYNAAHAHVSELGFSPTWGEWSEEDDQEGIARSVIADQIIGRYRLDDEGDPVDVKPLDEAILRALYNGVRDKRPAPTLEDARRLYLKESVKDNAKRRMQLDLVFKLMSEVVRLDRPIASLRREDARNVRDHMLEGRSPESVERYLNTVRAVLNLAIKEMDLEHQGVTNPFMKLPVARGDQAIPDRRKRDVFTNEELARVQAHIVASCRHDLQLIWRLMRNTGCRLAEITGLRVQDVRLDHEIPHVAIEWHERRRVKTMSSRRLVPLLGDALDAAREAMLMTSDGDALFPAYCRERGSDSASAALGKHVRACVKNPKLVTYSLRHRMADLLDLAGVSEMDRKLVLGHTKGEESEKYGSEQARLLRARRALEMALADELSVRSQEGRRTSCTTNGTSTQRGDEIGTDHQAH